MKPLKLTAIEKRDERGRVVDVYNERCCLVASFTALAFLTPVWRAFCDSVTASKGVMTLHPLGDKPYVHTDGREKADAP